MKSDFLVENEVKANIFAAKAMRISTLFLLGNYLLNALKVFSIDSTVMGIATGVSCLLLIIPTLLVNVLKIQAPWVKYVTVTLATLVVGILSICLSYHVVIIYVYGMLIASTFYSKKLNIYTLCVTTVILTICQVISYQLQVVVDGNITNVYTLVYRSILPRQLELLLISWSIIIFNERSVELLKYCMESNEQGDRLLGRLQQVNKRSLEVAKGMATSVTTLSKVAQQSSTVSRQTAESTEQMAAGVNETSEILRRTTQAVMNVAANLEEIAAESENVGELSQKVNGMSLDNDRVMEEATEAMLNIHSRTEESKKKIHKLGVRSEKIKTIVEGISGIASQTNLLAINASIEAARAGDGGRGFAVVAGEVGKLADQSQQMAQGIAEIIEKVVKETQEAIVAMDQSAVSVKEGMEILSNAKHYAEETQAACHDMNATIQELTTSLGMTAKEGETVSQTIEHVNQINEKHKEETTGIMERTAQQLSIAEEIVDSVKIISEIADELLEIGSQTNH